MPMIDEHLHLDLMKSNKIILQSKKCERAGPATGLNHIVQVRLYITLFGTDTRNGLSKLMSAQPMGGLSPAGGTPGLEDYRTLVAGRRGVTKLFSNVNLFHVSNASFL